MELGEKIKKLREEKGMTLEELGNLVGVGKSTVRKWESGMIANMKRDKIAKLATALSCSPAYLLGWNENDIETIKREQDAATAYQLEVDKHLLELKQMCLTEKELEDVLDYAKYLKSKRSD